MFSSYAELTQATVPRGGAVAVIPLGAVESHGPHLPLGTDGLIATGLLDRAAQLDRSDTPIVRLPLMWLGASAEHAGHPGTLSQEPEALIAQIVAAGQGLAAAGIDRVVLFNAHGGNVAAASIAALKLRTRFGLLAASVHWCDFGLPATVVPPTPAVDDVHGGWMETSILLHLVPHLVASDARAARPAAPPSPLLFPQGPVQWGWTVDDLTRPDSAAGGWIGRPDLATADLGAALVDHAARSLIRLLHDLAKADWPRSGGPG
ncbi:MAG: creatininase family protein [Rhodospirillaceae bacterium]|nr:creatininase family protein [Rhodospirillaceae bacterium]